MKKFFALMAAALLLFLSACETANHAGINHAKVEFTEGGALKAAEVWGGKESDSVELRFEHPDGLKAHYRAVGNKAFEGQRIRAEVHKALADLGVEVTPAILDAVTAIFGVPIAGPGP
jgi:hypothetical protein